MSFAIWHSAMVPASFHFKREEPWYRPYPKRTLVALLIAFAASAQTSLDTAGPYAVVAVYRIPDIPEISGIGVIGKKRSAGRDTVSCVAVSDKKSALFQFDIPLPAQPLASEEPLRAGILRTIDGAVDLEGVAVDKGGVWVCSEGESNSPSKVYFVPFDRDRPTTEVVLDSIHCEHNNGPEAIEVVPVNGTHELWVGKERFSRPDRSPPIHRFSRDDKGVLAHRGSFKIGFPLHRTQSAMAYNPVDGRVWLVSRELRTLFALSLTSISAGTVTPDRQSFSYRWDELLNSTSPYGMVEGIAFDEDGVLFVAFDNNGKKIGRDRDKKTAQSRLIVLRPRQE